mmetsp:Transcript_1659/g.5093  ORF Transcript_1659/g.5093 Transcript_1659/m.5093 type:complete len:234 (+) Transcript_1659:489-1190(+)
MLQRLRVRIRRAAHVPRGLVPVEAAGPRQRRPAPARDPVQARPRRVLGLRVHGDGPPRGHPGGFVGRCTQEVHRLPAAEGAGVFAFRGRRAPRREAVEPAPKFELAHEALRFRPLPLRDGRPNRVGHRAAARLLRRDALVPRAGVVARVPAVRRRGGHVGDGLRGRRDVPTALRAGILASDFERTGAVQRNAALVRGPRIGVWQVPRRPRAPGHLDARPAPAHPRHPGRPDAR